MNRALGRLLALASVFALSFSCGSNDPGGGPRQNQPSPTPPTAPIVRTLSPSRALVGSGDLILKIGGLGFQQSGQVRMRVTWTASGGSTELSGTVSDDRRLTAVVPAALLSSPASAQVIVAALDANGRPLNLSSLPVDFRVEVTPPAVGTAFKATGDMNTARSGHRAELLQNGRVLIVGGGDTSAEIFDPATGTFTPTGSMGVAREGFTATLLSDGTVLVAGGWEPNASGPGTSPLRSAELFDPVSGTFAPTGLLKERHADHTATALRDGALVLTGGGTGDLGAACQNIEDFTPASGAFTATGVMNEFRAGHAATLLLSGEIFLSGGWTGVVSTPPEQRTGPLFGEILDPGTHRSSVTRSSSTTRSGHASVLLADGRVLLLGGIPQSQSAGSLHQAEILDPVSGEFSAGPDVSSVQRGHSATVLPDGRVLFAGGAEGNTAVADAKLIDVEANQVLPAASLGTPRRGHTATVLSDGRVLITGGTDASGKALESAEIFE